MADSLASLRGKIAAFTRAALPDQRRFTRAGREALAGKFASQARAMGPCSDAELERRIKALKSAHYSRLALASAKSRRKIGRSDDAGAAETITGEETSDAEHNDTP